jgi:hypothetical protein
VLPGWVASASIRAGCRPETGAELARPAPAGERRTTRTKPRGFDDEIMRRQRSVGYAELEREWLFERRTPSDGSV